MTRDSTCPGGGGSLRPPHTHPTLLPDLSEPHRLPLPPSRVAGLGTRCIEPFGASRGLLGA